MKTPMKMTQRMFRMAATTVVALGFAANAAGAQTLEQKVWTLLDNPTANFVSLPETDFRALGADIVLPDQGRSVTDLATRAPGGAFDPRDVARIPAATLGYKADWIVERYRRYNLDWDITGLRLTSQNPEARNYPWVIIINGGAANFYEFFVDLKNRPGWAQFLAQKLNVMIVTIPGNFKYGGWAQPIADVTRQPAYLLDRDLPIAESEMRHVVYTNSVIMQGLKQLVMKNTTGDILMVGHSTSGELSTLAFQDPDMGPRFKGRYLGWGSGGPARLKHLQELRQGTTPEPAGAQTLTVLARRNPAGYSNGYSGVLNPFYEPGMPMLRVAELWMNAEARRRANFKQLMQDWEHTGPLSNKPRAELAIEEILNRTGNPWKVNAEDVNKDLFSTHFTRMDGYNRMVFMTARWDTNHWDPMDQQKSLEIFVANEYRRKNPAAQIRLINWDLKMTHYGHLELPQQLAGATYHAVRWLVR